jgi:hypothetical protein
VVPQQSHRLWVWALSYSKSGIAVEFSRFRFKLLEFLRLPFDIREPALRELLERTCGGVYRNYLARAERVEMILKSEDTLDLRVRVPLSNSRAEHRVSQ